MNDFVSLTPGTLNGENPTAPSRYGNAFLPFLTSDVSKGSRSGVLPAGG